MTRIGILGCGGRMGRTLIGTVQATPGAVLAGGAERSGSTAIGQDLGRLIGQDPLGLIVGDDPAALFARCDVAIDFTAPAATVAQAQAAAASGTALVVGTTGLDAGQQAALAAAAGRVAIVQAANFSLGVNLLLALAELVAARLGPDFDIEILEMHHRHKVDAPSGTALALGRAAAAGRKVALDAVARRSRDGLTGARPQGEIGFATLRGGDVVGDHEVIFAGAGERLSLGHSAGDRGIFARGAVRAALWAADRPAGLYGMANVLDLG